ncbi:MAG: NAD(+) diphosphatase [Prevotella sp.]|nr:NAD(+) diphosphatase [Prevotella sp.]MCM1075261.1 NAD(+) diphosphatase [Ruminococcus sp.]
METNVRYILKNDNFFVFNAEEGLEFPNMIPRGIMPDNEAFHFDNEGYRYIGYNVEVDALPSGYELCSLKSVYSSLCDEDYRSACKISELLHWDKLSRYCGRCGAQMQRSTEISKRCSQCKIEVFAPVSPAVIVLVKRKHEVLLVRARNFTRPHYGLVAGFVETGESLEDCVRREVREETSLEVRNIEYVGSQPWPYPNSLMLGFTAEYAGGELRFADGELCAGGFFSRDNLPPLPPHPSIARAMIERWLSDNTQNLP